MEANALAINAAIERCLKSIDATLKKMPADLPAILDGLNARIKALEAGRPDLDKGRTPAKILEGVEADLNAAFDPSSGNGGETAE
jgi:hypothetical protein